MQIAEVMMAWWLSS